jgi:hypothetical protein
MWFCEMRQMPRLRDCAAELTTQVLLRARDLAGCLKDRLTRGRVELIAPAAARPRFLRWVRPGA